MINSTSKNIGEKAMTEKVFSRKDLSEQYTPQESTKQPTPQSTVLPSALKRVLFLTSKKGKNDGIIQTELECSKLAQNEAFAIVIR